MSGSKILNMTFDNVTVGIAVLDTENVLYINRGLAKVFGYDHVKEMPENFASLFLSEFKPIIEDKICSKSEEKFKTKAYTARGDIITVSITARATYFESKKLCVLTVEDISEDEKLRMEKRIIEQQTGCCLHHCESGSLRKNRSSRQTSHYIFFNRRPATGCKPYLSYFRKYESLFHLPFLQYYYQTGP